MMQENRRKAEGSLGTGRESHTAGREASVGTTLQLPSQAPRGQSGLAVPPKGRPRWAARSLRIFTGVG